MKRCRFAHWLGRLEDGCLACLLALLLSLVLGRIGLRAAGIAAPGWSEPLTRLLVLWLGFLGGVAASRQDRHIAMDIAAHLLDRESRCHKLLAGLARLAAGAVSLLLALAAARFVNDERLYGADGGVAIPSWLGFAVLPLAFLLMAGHALAGLRHSAPREDEEP